MQNVGDRAARWLLRKNVGTGPNLCHTCDATPVSISPEISSTHHRHTSVTTNIKYHRLVFLYQTTVLCFVSNHGLVFCIKPRSCVLYQPTVLCFVSNHSLVFCIKPQSCVLYQTTVLCFVVYQTTVSCVLYQTTVSCVLYQTTVLHFVSLQISI